MGTRGGADVDCDVLPEVNTDEAQLGFAVHAVLAEEIVVVVLHKRFCIDMEFTQPRGAEPTKLCTAARFVRKRREEEWREGARIGGGGRAKILPSSAAAP